MMKIGITCRVDENLARGETSESLDVRMVQFISALNFIACPLSAYSVHPAEILRELDIDGLVLSGGNDIGSNSYRDDFEKELIRCAKTMNIPIIGVCRGMQMLCSNQGVGLKLISGHVGSKHEISSINELMDDRTVNSFHNYSLISEDLDRAGISIVATSKADFCVEAVADRSNNWMGIMWHPERDEPFHDNDLKLFRSYLSTKHRSCS